MDFFVNIYQEKKTTLDVSRLEKRKNKKETCLDVSFKQLSYHENSNGFSQEIYFSEWFFQRFFVGEIPSQACRDDPGHVGADAEDRGKIRPFFMTTWRIIPRILNGFFLHI